ncbi:MAG: ABC transporter ATP-binding protein [Deltaproteobacteria bacterium]|nr:ABC transporter ATP-binding protein [Deltaproteobacteria bacterium]
MSALLEVTDVRTWFPVADGAFRNGTQTVKAVDGVSFTMRAGEALGLAGESGCGKTTLGRTIVRLTEPTGGRVKLDGLDVTALEGEGLRKSRAQFQMIFQDPQASLNPRMTVLETLVEALQAHRAVPAAELRGRVLKLLEQVGLSESALDQYPHQFSGGQRQRIAIARALAVEPKLIVADEPVSALDVSIRAQILTLLNELRARLGLSLIFIGHDLAVLRGVCDRIAVMYLGRIVELGPARDVVDRPLHPYTQALISAVPVPDPERERSRQRIVLEGDPPSPLSPPSGCSFHPRCAKKSERCVSEVPPLVERDGRSVACHVV